MVPKVVTYIHLFHFAILFFHFCEDLLKKLIIVLLHLHVSNGAGQTIGRLNIVLRVAINVQQGNCLAECWFIV